MASCIQTNDLTKRFGSKLAVDHISLDVQPGEVFGLLGPNGAGKSTTLYMLTGLARPSEGSISIFGKDLRRNFLAIAPRIGVVTERPAVYDYLSVRDNLLYAARLAGRTVSIDRALARVDLLHAASKKAGTLSSGMRQRLGLALALLLEPELLVLDEPATGLDPEAQQGLLRQLRDLSREGGVTIIYSSHMLHEVEFLCNRVAIMNQGRIVACDETDSLIAYDESRVEVLIDSPEAAAKRLSVEPWVESAEASVGRVRVILRQPNVHQLTAFLVGAGYRISGVIPQRRTLQEYFLKVLNT